MLAGLLRMNAPSITSANTPLHCPQIVVFDLGKVLVDFDYGLVVRRVAADSRASIAELQQLLVDSPLLFRFERGEIDSREFFAAICEATGFDGGFERFATLFGDIFTPIESMVELHDRVRERGIPTCVFSNTNDLAIRHIRGMFPFFSRFKYYVLSYEHGVMKPAGPLYEVVERLSG